MNLRGALLVWIGLMGLAGTAAALALLRLFPRPFSESGPAVAWPWQSSQARPARVRGWLVVAAALASAIIAIAGLISFFS